MMNHRPNSLNLTEKPSSSQFGRKVAKLPLPKKRSKTVPLSERVTLERVLGVTVKDGSALACDPNTGLIAYPAGCAVVLFNPRKNRQSFIINHSKKTITTLAFSADGKNLVTGESGHRPAVRIWDVEDKTQVVEFLGHKFGITCVAFSPNGKYVVSVGEQHDKTVNVWDWKGVGVVASGKISSKVKSLAFAENGSYFVTVGNRNVKFWYLSSKRKTREALPLLGRAGILGEQRNNFFGDVACGLGVNSKKTYCITNSGFLCEFNERRLLDKWVELRVSSANSLFATEEHLFVGCADGVIRCFDASTLHFVSTLPRPHCLGVNVADGIDPSHLSIHKEDANYPDAIALTFDDVNKKLTCVYNDHSVYIWDVHDVKMVGKQWSSLYHSSCIWGVEVYPTLGKHQKDTLPPGSFITCSSDDTIRVWNLNHTNANDVFKKNVYSNELMKVFYIDDEKTHLTDFQDNPSVQTDKTDTGEGKNGVRCLCITSDGQHLASGDRSGNVHVHDLVLMQEVKCIEAHDSEVLCLSYSNAETGHSLLASASRDRLVHVFNLEDDYSLVETIDDHSSSITAVSFADVNGQLELISSGADKALMCRKAIEEPSLHFVRSHHIVGKATFHDLAVDPTCTFVATASQDRSVKIHHLATGKLRNSYKGALAEDGTLIRIEIDPSGLYAATSCSDKSIAIFDINSGDFLATMAGHAELVTGIKFSNDCKHLYSVSGDGCIFVWKLPWGMTYSMKKRCAEIEALRNSVPEIKLTRRGTYVVPPEDVPNQVPNTTLNRNSIVVDNALFQPARESMFPVEAKLPNNRAAELKETSPDYRFSVGQLPSWAKKQVMGQENQSSPSTYISPSQPKGRWAQRLDKGFKVKSDIHESIMLNLDDCMDRRRYTVEPDTISEQGKAHHPAQVVKKDENHKDTHDEEINVNEENFLAVEPRQIQTNSNVTLSRGCDPLTQPQEIFDHDSNIQWEPASSLDDQILELESLESQEKEFFTVEDEEEEEDEEEATVIIYPTSGDASPPSDSSTFQVTETSFIARKSRKSSKDEDKLEVNQGQNQVGSGDNSDDEDDEDDEDEEDDSRETSPTSRLEVNKGSETPQTPDEDDQKFLRTNYVFKERALFGKCMEQLEAQFASDLDFPGRLSLSSKFLSKSQHSQIRGRVEPVSINFNKPVDTTEYLQRRKDDMARAVDETRKRLQALGWKSMKKADTTSDTGLKRVGENLKDTDPVKKPKNVSKTSVEEIIVTSSTVTPNIEKANGRVLQERDGRRKATPDHQRNLSDSSTTTEDDSPPSNEVEKENIKNRYEKKKVSNTSKNRMDRLKARRENKSNTEDLKKSQSMTDLRSPEDIEEDFTSNSPSKKLVQRYRTRSHSRDRKQFDDSCDTTKLKRRARSEQNLQATPSRPKRSYEAGTMSSMAKKISKTPPQSPTSKIMKGKSLENLHSVRRQSDPKVDPKSLSARNSPMHYKSTENISALSKKAQQTFDDSKFLRRRSRSVSGEESSIDTATEMNPKPSKAVVPEIKVASGRPKSPRSTNLPREASRSPPHIRSKPSSPTMVKKRQGKRASDYVNNNGSSDDNSTKDTLDKLVMPPPATRTVVKAKAVVYNKSPPDTGLKASLERLEKTTPQGVTSQIVNMNTTHRDSEIPKKLTNVNDPEVANSINELPKTVSNISTVHEGVKADSSTPLETKQDKISLKDFSASLAELRSSFSKCLEMFTMVQSSTVDENDRQSMIDMFSSTYQTMDQSAKEVIPTLRTSILRDKRASTSPTPYAIANIESFRRSNRHSKRNGISSVDELESAATYSLLDQYSTMLVNMVQNKITANDKEKKVAIENGLETDSSSADDSTEKICYV